uniref:Autophagy-related protein n=1 Tax=Globodera pallida TaxID=36090 RepID=A0A183C1B3_GLOPA
MPSTSSQNSTGYVPYFKERKNIVDRKRMVQEILRQQTDKVPLIIERVRDERNLPLMSQCKYLVPAHFTVANVMQIIRGRLSLHPDQAFYLIVNEKSWVTISMTVGQLYEMEKDPDGFLYILLAQQHWGRA